LGTLGAQDPREIKVSKGPKELQEPQGVPEPEGLSEAKGLPEQKGLLETQGRLGTLGTQDPREIRGKPPHRSTVSGQNGQSIPSAPSLAALAQMPALTPDLAASRSIRRTAERIAKETCSTQSSAT